MIIIKQDEVMAINKDDVTRIISSLHGGNTLDDDIVVSMLLAMLPKQPSKAKNAKKWLTNAVATRANDPRPTLKVLWAIDGYLYASDGHRIHRIGTELTDGAYDFKTLEPINDNELKEYKFCNIFNSFDHSTAKTFLPKEMVRVILKTANTDSGKGIGLVHEQQEFFVNESYFMQAVNNNFKQTVKLSADKTQLYGQSEYGDFIVMNTRYDINEYLSAKDKD